MEGMTAATESKIQFDAIGQIAITVGNLARGKNFYRNKLGMKFLFDSGNMAFFQCGDIRLMIGTTEEPGPRGGTILYYKVQDIQETYAQLKDREVEFLQPPHLVAKMPDHELWMAFLKDPDGNVIGMMSELPHA